MVHFEKVKTYIKLLLYRHYFNFIFYIRLVNSIQMTQKQLYLVEFILISKQLLTSLLKRLLSINALFFLDDDLHLFFIVQGLLNSKHRIVGMYTSAKDDGTVKLSNTQEINDNPDEENKEQRFRPSTKLVRVKLKEFKSHDGATAFAKGVNQQGKDVHQIIVNAITSKLPLLESNNIEEPIVFTKDILITLAKLAFEQLIFDKTNEVSKYKKLDPERKKTQEKRRETQKKNHLEKELEQQYQNSLSLNDKLLYQILDLLQKRKNNVTTSTTEEINFIIEGKDIKKEDSTSIIKQDYANNYE